MTGRTPVFFYFNKQTFSLKNRKTLKLFISSVFKKEKTPLREISFVFCSDKEILKINKNFLKHNYYTDIITFDLTKGNDGKQAEIYISIDRVRDNSKIFKTSFKNELHRVIFHGVLHLCGYHDKSEKDIRLMKAMETKYLNSYFSI